ncbi:DUF1566 domain-containing protein [bacterium]|nr:DUF1566 domain-containing protein [bacterium]
MKKIFVSFAVLAAMLLMISCGGGSTTGDNTDTGDTSADGDSVDSGSTDTGTTEPTDTGTTEPTDTGTTEPTDTGTTEPTDTVEPDTAPDGGDTAPVPDGDNGDSTPDGGDTEPDNDYPQTPCDPNPCLSDVNSTGVCTINNNSFVCGCNSGYIFDGTLCIKSLPECSPTSDTPCIDFAKGLIWSAKSENKMPWNDALNYCQNLTEGDFNDWRLPSINVLKTLVQNCSSCANEDYTGKYSKFGDTVYLWSSSEGEDSTAQSIYFSDAGTYSVSIDTNVNVRCVRRETESRQRNCTGLIENSVWNTATQITQTWDWQYGYWRNSSKGWYNTDTSTSECHFKCKSSFFYDDGQCVNPCDQNPCINIGETGTCVGKSAEEYRCECEDNYFWNGSSYCLNPCEPNPCTGIGETGICVGTSSGYNCECEDNYGWSSDLYKCIKNLSCQNKPCNIPNSTGKCTPVAETQYLCECKENYYWWGEKDGCTTQKPVFGNICTGQTRCYGGTENTCPTSSTDYYFGQDAYYASLGKCTPQSFTFSPISGQKVVFDNNTGLMWQQIIPTDRYEWDAAISYCNNLTYAGYSDWRLPTPQEFLSIFDNSKFRPAIDTTYFLDTPSYVPFSRFWSSSTYVCDTSLAWYVDFEEGSVPSVDYKGDRKQVRCVRGTILPTGSFASTTVQGDVIVTDTETGLIWQKSYETQKTWQKALSYCENLTYAGYSDWRLPNKNELASLVNYEKHDPTSDFPDMPSRNFWSSSTSVYYTSSAWSVDFHDGDVSDEGKSLNLYVRCVR